MRRPRYKVDHAYRRVPDGDRCWSYEVHEFGVFRRTGRIFAGWERISENLSYEDSLAFMAGIPVVPVFRR